MTLLKTKQILFTSDKSHPRNMIDKNFNIFINSQNSKEISDNLASSLKQFVCNFVTVRWNKIIVSKLGIRYQWLWQRIHETYFCRFFTQKAFVLFQRKIRCTWSEFQRPKSPANSQGVSQGSHRNLQYKKNSRPLPGLTSYPRRFGIYQKLILKNGILLITSSLKTATRLIVTEHSCN